MIGESELIEVIESVVDCSKDINKSVTDNRRLNRQEKLELVGKLDDIRSKLLLLHYEMYVEHGIQ